MNVNRCFLAGNLVRDPETRQAGSSTVCNFTIAINRKWRGKDGADHDEAAYAGCQAWGKTGDTIAKYLKRGDPIFVEARMGTESYTDKDGKKVSKTRFTVESFQFVGSAKRDNGSSPSERQQQQRRDDRPKGDYSPADDQVPSGDLEIPF